MQTCHNDYRNTNLHINVSCSDLQDLLALKAPRRHKLAVHILSKTSKYNL